MTTVFQHAILDMSYIRKKNVLSVKLASYFTSWKNNLGKNWRIATSVGRMKNCGLFTSNFISVGISTLRFSNGSLNVIRCFRGDTTPMFLLSQPRNAPFIFSCADLVERDQSVDVAKLSISKRFAYYSNRILNGTQAQADTIWCIEKSECVLMKLMSFLAACRDGVVENFCTDFCLTNTEVIVPLSCPLFELVEHFSFFQGFSFCGFDDRLLHLAYQRV